MGTPTSACVQRSWLMRSANRVLDVVNRCCKVKSFTSITMTTEPATEAWRTPPATSRPVPAKADEPAPGSAKRGEGGGPAGTGDPPDLRRDPGGQGDHGPRVSA